MATVPGASVETSSPDHSAGSRSSVTALIDRWIYVFMAALFVVTALVGFIPDSLIKIAAVQAGQRPAFPPILHVHAVLMGTWLLLLLAQTILMATARPARHKQLGMASMVLAPVIVIAGIILAPTMYHSIWGAVQAAPAEMKPVLDQTLNFVSNILLFQIRVGIVFSLLIVLALRARRNDPGMHKRLMILATAIPLPAAIDRIQWLPSTLPTDPASIDLYLLLWISPMLLWDLFRLGRLHRAYVIWFAVNVPLLLISHQLWSSPWWMATVPRLMGVAG